MQVNQALFTRPSVYDFIDSSIKCIINNHPNLGINLSKEYWLFYFIQQDFFTNWMSINNYNIDQDVFGFPSMHILTRHCIESFLDLFNLYMDNEYIIVMSFCSKQGVINTGKFEGKKFNGMFTIQSKHDIAMDNGLKVCQLFSTNLNLVDIARKCNRYVHPYVYLDICTLEQKKEKLTQLLKTNLYIFMDSYRLILSKYNQGIQPTFNCDNCLCGRNCHNCLLGLKSDFENIINNLLLVEYHNNFYYI